MPCSVRFDVEERKRGFKIIPSLRSDHVARFASGAALELVDRTRSCKDVIPLPGSRNHVVRSSSRRLPQMGC